jgi:hypothetical protein
LVLEIFDIYRSALSLATALEPKQLSLMHAVKPNFLGFKTCRLRPHPIPSTNNLCEQNLALDLEKKLKIYSD